MAVVDSLESKIRDVFSISSYSLPPPSSLVPSPSSLAVHGELSTRQSTPKYRPSSDRSKCRDLGRSPQELGGWWASYYIESHWWGAHEDEEERSGEAIAQNAHSHVPSASVPPPGSAKKALILRDMSDGESDEEDDDDFDEEEKEGSGSESGEGSVTTESVERKEIPLEGTPPISKSEKDVTLSTDSDAAHSPNDSLSNVATSSVAGTSDIPLAGDSDRKDSTSTHPSSSSTSSSSTLSTFLPSAPSEEKSLFGWVGLGIGLMDDAGKVPSGEDKCGKCSHLQQLLDAAKAKIKSAEEEV